MTVQKSHNTGEIANVSEGDSMADADGYYGDDDLGDEELDISFLDDETK